MNNKKEYFMPHEPELLYLREKVDRLEAELEYYKERFEKRHSVLEEPELNAVSKLPSNYKIALMPLVRCTIEGEPPGGYHILLKTISTGRLEGWGYGYYVSQPELYSLMDTIGWAHHIHEKVLRTLIDFAQGRKK